MRYDIRKDSESKEGVGNACLGASGGDGDRFILKASCHEIEWLVIDPRCLTSIVESNTMFSGHPHIS